MTQAEIKKMAREMIGDGQSPNKWFVTVGPYVQYQAAEYEMDHKLIEGYSDKDVCTYGPFEDYEDAVDCYDEQELDVEYGVGQVMIEDREVGVVCEKWLTEKVKVVYEEDSRDDSHWYNK